MERKWPSLGWPGEGELGCLTRNLPLGVQLVNFFAQLPELFTPDTAIANGSDPRASPAR
jgi:hypothetical protein